MTECSNIELKEKLPELVAGSLDSAAAFAVEQHLAECASCSSELEILRAVRAAVIPVPHMNIAGIVRALPAPPIRVREVLPWYRRASLQLAAAFLLVAGGLVAVRNAGNGIEQVAREKSAVTLAAASPAESQTADARVAHNQPAIVTGSTPRTGIALVSGLDEMSTTELATLLKDIDGIAAVPVAEPEQFSPVSLDSAAGDG